MTMHSARAELQDAVKRLDHAWHRARRDWHDDVARQFHAEHIQPMIDHARAALSALAPLDEALAKARRECDAER